MLEERDHAVILRTLAGGKIPTAAIDARHDPPAASAGTCAEAAGSATPFTASTTASAPSSASSPAWPATPAAARWCSRPGSPGRWRARCPWAPARTCPRNRSAKSTSRRSAREQAEIEEDPHEEMLELELFYQLKGFSPEESRAMAERLQKEPRAVSPDAGPRGARPLRGNVSEPVAIHTYPRPYPTAIGGFIPIIPFFFTVGMPAVIASFLISTLAHFARRRLQGAGHDPHLVGERSRDDGGRRPRSRHHLRAGTRVRWTLIRTLARPLPSALRPL